jgi:ribosome-binding factor A
MANVKTLRASEDIRRELADIFRTVKDPRVTGFLTVVKVDLANDFSYAKIYVSAMDGIDAAKNAVKGLNSAAGYIRRELNIRLKLHKSPELKFIADDSIERSAQLLKLIDGLED